jgi:hypothetical protein
MNKRGDPSKQTKKNLTIQKIKNSRNEAVRREGCCDNSNGRKILHNKGFPDASEK